jgi:hypothetical protein
MPPLASRDSDTSHVWISTFFVNQLMGSCVYPCAGRSTAWLPCERTMMGSCREVKGAWLFAASNAGRPAFVLAVHPLRL